MGINRENREQQTEWDLHEQTDLVPLEFTEENNLKTLDQQIEAKAFQGLVSIEAERNLLIQSSINALTLEINSENMEVFEEHSKKWLKIRTQGYDKWKKAEKDYSLKYNALIDSKYNKEMLINKDWEDKFSNAKNHFKIIEEKKAKELNDLRISKISPYVENAEQMDFKEFSDEDFDDFVFGKKVKQEQRIAEEKAEVERLENERIEKEKEIEAQRLENIELKRISDEQTALRKKRNDELIPYSIYIRNYSELLEMEETEYQKQFLDIKKGASEQAEFERKETIRKQKIKADQDDEIEKQKKENAILAKELQAKKDVEIKAENERIAKEKTDKLEADKLSKAPIKKQMTVWVDSFSHAEISENETSKLILEKFESFKKWAKLEIEKL